MVDIAEKFGFQAIETINAFELSVPDLEFAKKLRQYADEKNITFACVSVGLDLVGEDREEAIQKVKGYADVAKILGSPYLHHQLRLSFKTHKKSKITMIYSIKEELLLFVKSTIMPNQLESKRFMKNKDFCLTA